MKPKAVALISGGLDSMLAAKLMLEQGVHVEGINFFTGFCVQGHTHAIRKSHQKKRKRNDALWVAEQLGIKLHIIDIVEEYKRIVINPKYGYGKNLNPCLDCKIFMIEKAKSWIKENGFDFIITGEVLGQRPKSQTKESMQIITSRTHSLDILLRPLCAQNLTPTLPETNGCVDRSKLLDITGRSRAKQMQLAEKFGFVDYAQPAGGCCFLTDIPYSRKLNDLWQYRGEKNYELDDIMLLKVGRHIRPKSNYKLIIGREEGENNFLQGYRKQFMHLLVLSHESPLVLLDGQPSENDVIEAARITARFSDGKLAEKVTVQITALDGSAKVINVKPMKSEEVLQSWYL